MKFWFVRPPVPGDSTRVEDSGELAVSDESYFVDVQPRTIASLLRMVRVEPPEIDDPAILGTPVARAPTSDVEDEAPAPVDDEHARVDPLERFPSDRIDTYLYTTYFARLHGRMNLAKRGGGGDATENAVLLGLQWLAKHQDEDGKWDADGFMKHDPPSDVCTGAAKMTWVDPGLTGLATLAFLGAGHTHRYGTFKETVKKAVQYLMKIQAANGLIGGQRGHYMYNHSVCALALTEAYGMTLSPLIQGAAEKSIEYLIAARNPGRAWRYAERDGDNDLSVTGWCVTALCRAKAAEIEVRGLEDALEQAGAWMESVTNQHGVSGYRECPPPRWRGPTSSRFENAQLGVKTKDTHAENHTPTAIATMCRVVLGYAQTDQRLMNGATMVSQMPPMWDTGGGDERSRVDYYYWYYATLAMFQVGGQHWKWWNQHMKAAIVPHQITQPGSTRGSWDPIDAWSFAGGRVYATALNVLTLETYYRYPRAYAD